jgi:hypothetical protein
VVSSSGLISQNNSEGFYMVGSSLENFVHWQNLTLCALGLQLVAQMIPEFRFSDNFVTSEKSNGKDFWVGFLLSGKFASEHEVLSNLKIFLSIPSFEEKSRLDLELPWGLI